MRILRTFVSPIVFGVFILAALVATMKLITLDLRVITLFGALLPFGYSYRFSPQQKHKLLSSVLVVLPTAVGFVLAIIPELPTMWTAIVIFWLGALLGHWCRQQKVAFLGLPVFFVFSLGIVPLLVEQDLSEYQNTPAPTVRLNRLQSDGTLALDDLKGKVVLLDFFGTWCQPCLEEMEELKNVRHHFENRTDIELFLVCTAFGKDTPEKAKAFLKRHALSFEAFFDGENEAHEQFGFTGVPALVIIDKKGMVRYRHEGYNTSENLSANLIETITALVQEP